MHNNPKQVELDTKLKPFLPSYLPSIGEPDPFLKIPRPDGIEDGLGTVLLDEVVEEDQSDAAVLELQLRYQAKKKTSIGVPVRSIDNASKNPEEIDKWIENVEKLHRSKPPVEVRYSIAMPDMKNLIKPFPQEIHEMLENKLMGSFNPDIDLTLEEYGHLLCTIIDIPVQNGSLIESLHVMFKIGLLTQDMQDEEAL